MYFPIEFNQHTLHMGLSTDQIIKILQLKNIGRKTAFKIQEKSINQTILNDKELADYLTTLSKEKLVPNLPSYTLFDFKSAFDDGNLIIESSLNNNIKYVSFYEPNYPLRLKLENDPPIILNYKGNIEILNSMKSVAIIGTREPNKSGESAAHYFGKKFGGLGFNVVSGLAIGCDSFGHKGCVESNGITTAILAHGLQTIYPKENRILAQKIIELGGLLVSEYFYGVTARPNFFVERDRLQAGLADATIVIQTDIKGGTMHAINSTLKSEKPLAAGQYKSDSQFIKTRGNEFLIKEGKAFALTSTTFEIFLERLQKNDFSQPKNIIECKSKENSIVNNPGHNPGRKHGRKSKSNLKANQKPSDEPTLF